jgi:hypothetical protein
MILVLLEKKNCKVEPPLPVDEWLVPISEEMHISVQHR